MALEHFIKFDGVEGESAQKDHKGDIEVLSWSWGLSSPAPVHPGGGGGAGRPTADELTFTHLYDKASPVLAGFAAGGRHIKQAWLTARRAGEGQKDFLKVTMTDVVITGVHQAASDAAINESVSASFAHITFEYRPMDAKGGIGTPVIFDWDLVKLNVK